MFEESPEPSRGEPYRPPDPLASRARQLAGDTVIAISAAHEAAAKAAAIAAERGYCRPWLIGEKAGHGLDPERDPRRLEMLDLLLRLPAGRRLGMREAERLAMDPTFYSALLVAAGRAGGAIAGRCRSTAEAVRGTLGPSLDGPGLALGYLLGLGNRWFALGMALETRPSAVEAGPRRRRVWERVSPPISKEARGSR